jgi:hypothetical protein
MAHPQLFERSPMFSSLELAKDLSCKRKLANMLRLVALTTIFSVSSGARSWTTVIVDPAGALPSYDRGRNPQLLKEGDPHLTRTTYRPTCTPTITPEPTSFPSEPGPSIQPSSAPTGIPSMHDSSVPSGSPAPTTSIIPSISSEPTGTLGSRTLEPSYPPGSVPSSEPSRRVDHDIGNGGCAMSEVLYEVILYDQFGDGWDGLYLRIERLGDDLTSEVVETQHLNGSQYVQARTVYSSNGASNTTFIKFSNSSYPMKSEVIKDEHSPGDMLSTNPVFQDTIVTGDVAIRYACLQPGRCYEATILEGRWADEISWEIRKSTFAKSSQTTRNYEPIVNGGAPSNCTFSVPGDRGALPKMFCPSECHVAGQYPLLTTGPSATPITSAPVVTKEHMKSATILVDMNAPSISMTPSKTPTTVPTSVPSVSPTQIPSYAPTSLPSFLPTALPSSIPSIVPSMIPSGLPSNDESAIPTVVPTTRPSLLPTLSVFPTSTPSSPPSEWKDAYKTVTRPPNSSGHKGESPEPERRGDDDPPERDGTSGIQSDGDDTTPVTHTVYNGGTERDSLRI